MDLSPTAALPQTYLSPTLALPQPHLRAVELGTADDAFEHKNHGLVTKHAVGEPEPEEATNTREILSHRRRRWKSKPSTTNDQSDCDTRDNKRLVALLPLSSA